MLKPIEQHLIYAEKHDICKEETMIELGFPLYRYHRFLTDDTEEIVMRQQLFENVFQNKMLFELLCYLHEQCTVMSELIKSHGSFDSNENEEILYSMKELLVFTETVDTISMRYDEIKDSVTSRRLQGFFSELYALSFQEQYRSVKGWLSEYATSLKNLQSITLGVNLDAQFNAKEVGIVAFHDKPFISASGIGRFLRAQKPIDEFSCIATLGIKESGLTEKKAIAINSEFYTAINNTIKRSAKNIKKILHDTVQKTITSLVGLREELKFIIDCTNYHQKQLEGKLPCCFPRLSNTTKIEMLYNPLLLGVCSAKDIVPNNFSPSANERIFLLTGPNSGGKTSFIKSLGLAWLSFQLGLPIPARKAEMKPIRRIVTHFVKQSNKQSEGRLANESARLRDSIENLTENSLFLLDETFSGTNSYDAVIFSEALIRYLARLPNCYTVYITHLLELNERLLRLKNEDRYRNIKLLSAGISRGKRSYEIVPYHENISLSGFAKDVLLENGLGFLFEETIEDRGYGNHVG